MLCEISHAKKEKYYMVSFVCRIIKEKKKANSWKNSRSMVPGADVGAWGYKERLIKEYKLLAIRWTTFECLMYNMLTIVKNTYYIV